MRLFCLRFGHLLTTLRPGLFSPDKLKEYARVIARKGAPLKQCIGFVDGTVRAMARPSHDQRQYYNGHKRVHALKFQALVLPNGITARESPGANHHFDYPSTQTPLSS